jgi:hypothetical protein
MWLLEPPEGNKYIGDIGIFFFFGFSWIVVQGESDGPVAYTPTKSMMVSAGIMLDGVRVVAVSILGSGGAATLIWLSFLDGTLFGMAGCGGGDLGDVGMLSTEDWRAATRFIACEGWREGSILAFEAAEFDRTLNSSPGSFSESLIMDTDMLVCFA